jgi:cbb3-type cytochrome oxidase maturation protein
MEILLMMIPISFILSLGFLFSFIWSIRHDQWQDVQTPAHRILFDDQHSDKNKGDS